MSTTRRTGVNTAGVVLNATLSGDDALSAIDGEWLTHFNFRSPNG